MIIFIFLVFDDLSFEKVVKISFEIVDRIL